MVVEIRAFRGTRRASVYREHVLADGAYDRIVAAAARRGLALLPSLARGEPHELDKRSSRRLAGETTDVRMSGELPELDRDLVAIVEVARWCARSPGDAWLRIQAA